MYDAVCLASGGLDSIVCLHLLRKQGIKALPVFINYGQRNLGTGREHLRYFLRDFLCRLREIGADLFSFCRVRSRAAEC